MGTGIDSSVPTDTEADSDTERADVERADTEPADDRVAGGDGSAAAALHPAGWSWRLRHPSIEAVVLWLLVAVGLRIGLQPLGDNSFLTHLATGRLILDEGAVPVRDPYTFTALGEPWTVQSWGASVLYALSERTIGLVGIRLIDAACVVALVLALWRLSRVGTSLVARILVSGLVVSMGTGLWVERPLLFGALFLALVLLAAEDVLDPRWLVPIMWLWVNIHGSFPFGVAILVLLAAGRWLDERHRPVVELRALGWAVLGTLLGAVGPLGIKALLFPLDLLSDREAFEGIAEWAPPEWERGVERFFALQLAICVVAVLVRHRRWRAVLPMVVFGLAAIASTRNILQASIVLTPIMAASLHGLGRIDGTRRPRLVRPVAIAMAALTLVVGIRGVSGPDTVLDQYPEEAAEWMRAEDLLDRDTRVVSRDYAGNYLEFRYGPGEVRTFFDDRVDMFPIQVIRDYRTLLREGADLQPVFDRAGATAVLWDRDSTAGRWLVRSEAWDVVYQDEEWLVAVPAGRTSGD